MKKTPLLTIALLLSLALAALPQTVAWAQQPAAPAAPQPAVCAPGAAAVTAISPAADPAGSVAPIDELLAPAPTPQAICRFRCPTTECHRDSECTAAPGGVCTTVCPSQGCCSYPA